MSKLLEVHPKNVIVTGSPGAELSKLALLLEQQGWLVSYPGQDLDIFDGLRFKRHGFNVEVARIHESMDPAATDAFAEYLPDYYETPYPGPEELVAQFKGKPAVFSGYTIAPRLDMWRSVADIVIAVMASPEEDKQRLLSYKVPEGLLDTIRDYQVSKLSGHLKLFSKVFTMTNAEVKDDRFEILSKYLSSVV